MALVDERTFLTTGAGSDLPAFLQRIETAAVDSEDFAGEAAADRLLTLGYRNEAAASEAASAG